MISKHVKFFYPIYFHINSEKIGLRAANSIKRIHIDYVIHVAQLCNIYEYYVTKLRKHKVLRQAKC